jgi:SH3 domain protein
MFRTTLLSFLLLLASFCAQAADTRYVTDELEVTLRTGPSTGNKILRIMNSGEALRLIEADEVSQYSLVETAEGEQGYVISRFLIAEPIARQQLETLRERHQAQQQRVDEQASQISQLSEELQQSNADNEVLKTTLRASEQELAEIRNTAQDTLNIQDQNMRMQTVIDELREEQVRLSEENARLSDTTKMDWFLRGGAVSLIAFVIGILVTRIRWRKQDSWGSY